MSAAKHTPGPWRISSDSSRSNPIRICDDTGADTIAIVCNLYRAADNARLIAAAPELAEALARVAEFLHANYAVSDMPDILPMVDAALAKAQS
jgi:hypothetical protein